MAHAKFVEHGKPDVALRLTFEEAANLREILRNIDFTDEREDTVYESLSNLGFSVGDATIEAAKVRNGILLFQDKVPF